MDVHPDGPRESSLDVGGYDTFWLLLFSHSFNIFLTFNRMFIVIFDEDKMT